MSAYILLVDQDLDDHSLVKETLEELALEVPVRYARSSSEMYRLLEETRPSLILIDFNTSPENGLELLTALKDQEAHASIPVVILSESKHAADREAAYRLGAATYVQKPASLEGTRRKIETFFRYWQEVAEL